MTLLQTIDIHGSQARITRIGFGCARLFGGAETRASARLIETALACGIRHFDTAPPYGDGCSEQVLGEVLRGMTDVTLASKVGIPRPAGPTGSWRGRWYRRYLRPALAHAPGLKRRLLALAERRPRGGSPTQAAAPTLRCIDPALLMQELETSLALLRRDALDLYLIHEPEGVVIDDELLTAVAALRHQGLIRAFGYAFGSTASTVTVPAGIDVVQSHYSPEAMPGLPGAPTQVFHGVMRRQPAAAALRRAGDRTGDAGPRALAAALRRHPQAAFLFSASTPRQIREVMAVVKDECVLCGS